MKVHYFQHVPFEGLGSIECELKHKCHKITSTKLYNEEINVSPKDIDWLIVMGGPWASMTTKSIRGSKKKKNL
jgi:CRISPR/Cas system CSM-associated protein Csm4 (group 5 of RAMP superfamily)